MNSSQLAAIVFLVCLVSYFFLWEHPHPLTGAPLQPKVPKKRVRFSAEAPDVWTFENISGERTLNVSVELQKQYDANSARGPAVSGVQSYEPFGGAWTLL